VSFKEALERKGVLPGVLLNGAAHDFRPVRTELLGKPAWFFDGVTTQSIEKLIDRFIGKRLHLLGIEPPELEPGMLFRFEGNHLLFEVVSIEDDRLIYIEPGDPTRYGCGLRDKAITIEREP
jgi:hypothetical protein